MATTAAVTAFRRAWSDPDQQYLAQSFATRRGYYALLWAHYENSIFEDLAQWGSYRARHKLYRQTRSIYNPTRRLVDLYAGAVYPGVLSEDGHELPDGVPLAIPLADDINPALRSAIAQTWQWSNWQAGKGLFVRYGAALGSVLVEISDDVDRGKLSYEVRWPGFVSDLELDGAGNVKSYALEYEAREQESGNRYVYRKEVGGETFRTFKDSKPFDYDPDSGQGAEWANPYGFVPAVWVRHKSVGSDFGAPAIDGSLGKIDELNSLASRVHDQIHKVVGAPWVFWTSAGGIKGIGDTTARAATDDLGSPPGGQGQDRSDRQDLLLLQGPPGGNAQSLAGNLPLDQALAWAQALVKEIEEDHSELVLWRQLREMSTLTGPAASRVMGDAAGNIFEAAAQYDEQSRKLFQMSVAIAGWRTSNGWRGPLTRQQKKFAPFDLISYERGELDFAIVARPIVPPTKKERADESLARGSAAAAWVGAGMPLELALVEELGWDQEDADALTVERVAAIQRQQTLAQSDVPTDPSLAAVRQ